MEDSRPILVVIHCLVYNHEPYLRMCLDGFVSQKTNFRYIAIVHDDASTDNSASIIREYEEKYPDIIKAIYETENQWSKGNVTQIMKNAIDKINPKYLALCEGDDYWTDSLKLQKQFDIMETHPGCSVCFHRTDVFDCEKNCIDWSIPKKDTISEGIFTLTDYMKSGYCMHTSSLFYKRAYANVFKRDAEYPFFKNFTGDAAIMIYLLLQANGYFIPDTMSCYRLFAKGSHNERKKYDKWAGINQYSKFIVGYRELDKLTNYKYHEDLISKIRWCLFFILDRAMMLSYRECRDTLKQYFDNSPELVGLTMSHVLQRKRELPFWLFFWIEKVRRWKNKEFHNIDIEYV